MNELIIDARTISKSFSVGARKVDAIKNVCLKVRGGEFIAITGPSGSGKSTLLNILALLDAPTDGQYLFEGNDLLGLSHDRLASIRNKKIGFVFQSFNLLARNSALENVELPLVYAGINKRRRIELAMKALNAVGLADRADHRPHQLSGGEQQRVSIARALVNDPLLIFADEPTGSLDSKSGCEVMRQLQKLHRLGRTIVMVTHDPLIANQAKRIIDVMDGQIIADAPVRDLSSAGVANVLAGGESSNELVVI